MWSRKPLGILNNFYSIVSLLSFFFLLLLRLDMPVYVCVCFRSVEFILIFIWQNLSAATATVSQLQ